MKEGNPDDFLYKLELTVDLYVMGFPLFTNLDLMKLIDPAKEKKGLAYMYIV
jgi:hypothetical protein